MRHISAAIVIALVAALPGALPAALADGIQTDAPAPNRTGPTDLTTPPDASPVDPAGPYKVEMVEMTGDNCVDLVLGYHAIGVVTVEAGDCMGRFTRIGINAFVTAAALGDRHIHNLVLRDIDGDGRQDLAAAIGGGPPGRPGTVLVARNMGNGRLVEQARLFVPSTAKGVALGDFDGDGNIDLAATAEGRGSGGDLPIGRLYVWPGRGGFGFGEPVYVETGFVAYNVLVADLNHDATTDFIVPNAHTDYVSVVLNPGRTLFTSPLASIALTMPRPPGYDPPRLNDAATTDLNLDGNIDVIAVSTNGGLVGIWYGRGDGTFEPPQVRATGSQFSAFATTCDLNTDGYPDVIVTHYTQVHQTSVFIGSSGGLFPRQSYATDLGSYGVACANFDGPGSPPDVVTANYAARTISVMRSNGDGTLTEPVEQWRGLKLVDGQWEDEPEPIPPTPTD